MTGEGIGDLDNSIKFDNTINENKKNTLLLKEKNEGKNKNNHNKKDCIIY